MRRLEPQEYDIFIETIGHSPKTTITIHYLKQNLCDVYLIGTASDFEAAIVQEKPFPTEPTGYGKNAQAMWDLLSKMSDWDVVDIEPDIAGELASIMHKQMNVPIRQYGDIYYHMTQTCIHHTPTDNVTVRLLNSDDLTLVKQSVSDTQSMSFGNVEASLKYGIVAGAIVGDEIVAMADSHLADHYINVGVFTHEQWRKKGLASAVASLVIIEGQQRGLIPVWSVGADNIASHRVAEKLGYEKVSERVYLIPQQDAK